MKIRGYLLFALAGAFPVASLTAQTIPGTVNYQGRLTDNTPQQNPVSGSVYMRFAIHDAAAGGAPVWQEPAGGGTAVAVNAGIFSVQLGAIVPIPAAAFTSGADRWLEITLNPGAGNEEILAPRQKLSATGYAMHAGNAATAATATSATTAAMASDSQALGGIAAAGWQRTLSTPNCPAGEYLSGFSAAGSPSCATPATVLPVPMSLIGSSNFPILSATQNGGGHGLISSIGATGSPSVAAVYGYHGNGGQAGQFITGASGIAVYAEGVNGYGVNASVTGTGRAGYFNNNSATNANPALTGTTTGTGDGIYGFSPANNGILGRSGSANDSGIFGDNTAGGNGVSGYTTSTNASRAGVYGQNFGNGPGVYGYSGGTGWGGYFQIFNASNNSAALVGATNGGGIAVQGFTSGAGRAGHFEITNAASSSQALFAASSGTGTAGWFQLSNAANGAAAVYATTGGTGSAGIFQLTNASSSATALNVSTSGTGSAATFLSNNAGSPAAAVWARSGGFFTALLADVTSPGTRPLIARGAAGQTANLQEWQSSGGAALAAVTGAGIFMGNGSLLTNINAATVTSGVYTTGSYADPAWITSLAGGKITGSVADSASLGGAAASGWQRALTPAACPANFYYSGIAQDGAAICSPDSAPVPLDLVGADPGPILNVANNGAGGGIIGSARTGAGITARADDQSAIPLVAAGAPGQSVDLQQWRDDAGASLASVNFAGVFNGNGSGLNSLNPAGLTAGTAGISISGNAATVTNGVYTSAGYSDPAWITALSGAKITGSVASASAVTNGVYTTGSYADPAWITTLSGSKIVAPLNLSGNIAGSVLSGSNTSNTVNSTAVRGTMTVAVALGITTGVRGEVLGAGSSGSYGVWGSNVNGGVGVNGTTDNGRAIQGNATAGTGGGIGVYGSTSSSAGYGLYTPDRTYSGGGYVQPGTGGEALRIVRGRVSSAGGITAGGGFTVTKGTVGLFTVNYSSGFPVGPTVTVTVESGVANRCATLSTAAASVTVRTFNCDTGTLADYAFGFIAVGES